MKNILITGGAGFIGSHLIDQLLAKGHKMTCIDNFDDFYNPQLKYQNIAQNSNNKNFTLIEEDILNLSALQKKLKNSYDAIIHLAARVGVRPSIENPALYQQVNILGTQNLLELARELKIKQFIFASSSSVYGVNPNFPWNEDDFVLKPISPYASSKLSCELLGHVYSHLYGIRFIALRFFTVYGPRQRPDLAINKFFRNIINNKAIDLFGDGSSERDYTYVDDIVNGIISAIYYDKSKYEIINLGNNKPVVLKQLIQYIETVTGIKAKINYLPEQAGDVSKTYASIDKAARLLDYKPETDMLTGLNKFYEWLKNNP